MPSLASSNLERFKIEPSAYLLISRTTHQELRPRTKNEEPRTKTTVFQSTASARKAKTSTAPAPESDARRQIPIHPCGCPCCCRGCHPSRSNDLPEPETLP